MPRRSHPAGARFGRWAAPDGWVLRRMDWPQAGRRKARGSLLFAGGRGDFIEKYLEAYGHWHARGWNVTAFDWRGQGASRGKGFAFDSFDAPVDDLAALIEDVGSGAKGPHVAVGHSMGGHLLLRTLVERRPALDAAVLVAPMIGVNSTPIPAWLAPDLAATMAGIGFRHLPMWKTPPAMLWPGGERQRRLTSSRERYEDEAWWWRKEPGWKMGAPTWGWVRAAYRSAASAFTPERLAAVETPLLLLGTATDRLVSVREIERAAAAIPGAELELYPDGGHEILREGDPIRLAALARIDAFLNGHAR